MPRAPAQLGGHPGYVSVWAGPGSPGCPGPEGRRLVRGLDVSRQGLGAPGGLPTLPTGQANRGALGLAREGGMVRGGVYHRDGRHLHDACMCTRVCETSINVIVGWLR